MTLREVSRIFEHCDRDLPDSAYDLQTTAAPDPRADAQHRSADGSRHSGPTELELIDANGGWLNAGSSRQSSRRSRADSCAIPKPEQDDGPVPDFSTLSRRGLRLVDCLQSLGFLNNRADPSDHGQYRLTGLGLQSLPQTLDRTEPIHLTMDSTGLKIFGEGEWLQVKHETKAKRKSWRKLQA